MNFIRYLVQSARPPRSTETLKVAEAMHKALVRQLPCRLFRGTDEGGRPLKNENHLRIYPESNHGDNTITHISLWAPKGFSDEQFSAASSLRKLWARGLHDLHLYPMDPRDCQGGFDLEGHKTPILMNSPRWISRTPFVCTLKPSLKRDGSYRRDKFGLIRGGPEYDLRRLAVRDALPDILSVKNTGPHIDRRCLPGAFISRRRGGSGLRGAFAPVYFELTFASSLQGPLSLGYGQNLGLGQFWPVVQAQ